MKRSKVLITGALHPGAIKAFSDDLRFELDYHPDCPREQLLKKIGDFDVLISRSETTVDQAVIEAGKELRVVARAAVGVGNIDLDFATTKGILVINCPGKNTNSAAELTMGLILSMFRNIPEANATVKAGGWDRHRFSGFELRNKKIGIVGLGNVGHRVARFAKGLEMEVYAFDPYIAPDIFRRHGAHQAKSLVELASIVDVLSLHTPLNKETRGMITSEVLDAMHQGSYFVNAARGGLVDEELLVSYLKAEKIAGCAIDTFENEPTPMAELVKHPRAWVTPHIGATTVEAQKAIGKTVYEQVVKACEGGVVDYPVNLPQIGIIKEPVLKSYAVLAEKLGSLVGQTISFNPHSVEIHYRGDIAELDHALVRMGFMKGYANCVVDGFVSFVNVEQHFEKLGIKMEDKEDPEFASYRSALKIYVRGVEGEQLTLGGIVFDDSHARISLINDYYFEMEADGHFLLVENNDRPGVIGDLGTALAKNGVNIDKFELSRNRKGGKAMSMIRVDNPVEGAALKAMRVIKNVLTVKSVSL